MVEVLGELLRQPVLVSMRGNVVRRISGDNPALFACA
jgi:hypothetical protein